MIITGLQYEAGLLNTLEPGDDAYSNLRILISKYSFLLYWFLVDLESTVFKGQVMVHSANKSRPKVTQEFTQASNQVIQALEACCLVLKMNLSSMFVTSSEKDQFCGLFLKPVYLFMESEQLMKNTSARMYMFKVICLSVKTHGQQNNVHTSLMQMLIYFEHLPEPLAELLQILYEQYDHQQIADDMMRELSNRNFNANDTKGPKLISTFTIKLAQLVPSLLMKQMTSLVRLLESESFTLRCAIIESSGNVIFHLAKQQLDDEDERIETQLNAMMDLIEERVLDVNPYARARAIQVLIGICELERKFVKRRQTITNIAVKCLQDRSVIVRRNAVKLLSRLVSTHPFDGLHGSQLGIEEWQQRLEQVKGELDNVLPEDERGAEGTVETEEKQEEDGQMELDAPSDDEQQQQQQQPEQTENKEGKENKDTAEMINRLKLTKKYYMEAIEFIHLVHTGVENIETLLFSKNKNEIIDSMDFLVLCDAYGIELARSGIRKMIHLIWAKANNDEGQVIQSHLIQCYQSLFFDTPMGVSENDADLIVARNLISLTYSATLAELASLEHLLVQAMNKQQLIAPGVVKMLWKIYGYQQREISKSQRRGAIIILGMLSKADSSIATSGLELLLKIGLDDQGKKDLGLAKYTCICLQRCVSEEDWKKSGAAGPAARLPKEHEAIDKLCRFLLIDWISMEWFGVAEQAIEAINNLCIEPDLVFTRLIQLKANEAFTSKTNSSLHSLAQLLFIVGEVALKVMVHLERCEAMFKRAKVALEKKNDQEKEKKKQNGDSNNNNDDDDDLDMVGGNSGGNTTEDDFTDAIAFIRERELLYGEKSLLARFGPLVGEICKRQVLTNKAPEYLSAAVTLCLSKFSCVSSQFCEDNLPILMTLLEKSDKSFIRSNSVLALGDIAVCFNHILDDNTDFLYKRLHDKYPVVQRTCLMTLTFLILAGQVKVKGQLGEMAKCLQNPDSRIADLSRMFFTELATKDNAIYNGFIDMFSVLSADQDLSQDDFHKILKFLVSFIDKDKQVKNLADKLHARMSKCESAKVWNDLVYVLNLLPHKNEEIQKVIADGFKFVPSSKTEEENLEVDDLEKHSQHSQKDRNRRSSSFHLSSILDQ